MDGTFITGDALESALKDDTLAPSGYTVVGMTKPSSQAKHIAFTNSGCDNWLDIPSEMIAKAEHLGDSPCKDHSHPVFRLTLNVPKDKNAGVLYALMSRATSPPTGAGSAPISSPGVTYAAQPGQSMAYGATSPMMAGGGSAAMARQIGRPPGGLGGLGGLNAWGCWDSTCTECLVYEYVCNGTACWNICKVWIEKPCERCIWPW